jgi:hypothetical protein
MTHSHTRRTFVLAGAASASLMLLPAGSLAAAAKQKMTTYRSPTCGCCFKWIAAARSAGFDVAVIEVDDMMAVKAKHGIPDDLLSCHTTLVGGFVVEGHVPFHAIERLLAQRPKLKGIAVAGMPLGSPGMDAPAGRKQAYNVMAFDAAGKVSVFVKG